MQIDKTTLADLSIFHAEEEQSVFYYLNNTQTNGGREFLRYLMGHPLETISEIHDTQLTIKQLMVVSEKWTLMITNGNIMMIEKFYESQLNQFSEHPSKVNTFFYSLINKQDFSLIKYSVGHAIDFTKGLQQILDLLSDLPLSKKLSAFTSRITMLLHEPTIQRMMQDEKNKLSDISVLEYGGFIRNHFKNAAFELIDIYSKLDAYMSMARTCKKYAFCFPLIEISQEPYIKASGLFHLLLQTPVAYDIDISRNRNFLFLTGANMAGKSTFIKAVGVSAFLAHLGMGVPAKEMRISFLDGLLSNIQVVDNIMKGESFFFNEVQRIKNTIEKISDGKNWLILIDELFKGTNQQDAVKCSTTVVEGLRKMKNALFILSTHLYEIGEELKQYSNIQFHYFETSVKDDQLLFSYQLKEGISNDRLGYLILRKEGVVDLLEKL